MAEGHNCVRSPHGPDHRGRVAAASPSETFRRVRADREAKVREDGCENE